VRLVGYKMGIDKMTFEERKARYRFLKNQARQLIREENDLKIYRALAAIRDIYTGRISKRFDPGLSSKVDCLNWLIEN